MFHVRRRDRCHWPWCLAWCDEVAIQRTSAWGSVGCNIHSWYDLDGEVAWQMIVIGHAWRCKRCEHGIDLDGCTQCPRQWRTTIDWCYCGWIQWYHPILRPCWMNATCIGCPIQSIVAVCNAWLHWFCRTWHSYRTYAWQGELVNDSSLCDCSVTVTMFSGLGLRLNVLPDRCSMDSFH